MRAASVKQLARGEQRFLLFLALCHAAPRVCSCRLQSSRQLKVRSVARLESSGSSDRGRLVSRWPGTIAHDPSRFASPPPCSGLSCSSQVPVSSSTASQTTGGLDHWGDLTAALLDQVVVPAEATVHAASPRSQGGSPAIFHPLLSELFARFCGEIFSFRLRLRLFSTIVAGKRFDVLRSTAISLRFPCGSSGLHRSNRNASCKTGAFAPFLR